MDKGRFFAAAAPPAETMELEGFGAVRVVALSLRARLDFSDLDHEDTLAVLDWLVCQGVEGLGPEDLEQVQAMDGGIKQDIADIVVRLSGLSDEVDDVKNG